METENYSEKDIQRFKKALSLSFNLNTEAEVQKAAIEVSGRSDGVGIALLLRTLTNQELAKTNIKSDPIKKVLPWTTLKASV